MKPTDPIKKISPTFSIIFKALTLDKDEKIDLALLKIIEIYKNNKFIKIKNEKYKFPYVKIKETKNGQNEKIRKTSVGKE